jgi:NAD(P)-dependent dehydrogenase (short-subunit alcohol dehydrogenase family)
MELRRGKYPNRLTNKAAIVRGRVGHQRAIAITSPEGARVVAADLQPESRLDAEQPPTVEVIEAAGGEAMFVKTDVTRRPEVEAMVEAALERFGHIDILVNNAGVFVRNAITEVSDQEWDQVMNVNLRGYFYTCRRVIPEMLKRGGGKIVNLSSIHGIRGTGTATTYCASKAPRNLTRQLAVEYGRRHLREHIASTIKTAMSKPFREDRPSWPTTESHASAAPGQPQDVADCALFLASEDRTSCTGTLVCDGGWTIW